MSPTATKKPPASAPRSTALKTAGKQSPVVAEIVTLANEAHGHLRRATFACLRIGLRLLVIHREERDKPGGFRAALDALEGCKVPAGTAYRWINAAGAAVCLAQELPHIEEIEIPDIGCKEWQKLEAKIEKITEGLSLRRLIIGSAAVGEESRLDSLIHHAEQGDTHADEILEEVAKGKLTLVQAIRKLAGQQATKGKERKDPVYLEIDGTNGEPKGLFVKSMATIVNTFTRWDLLDPTARSKAKASWKELVAILPKDLR